MPRKSQTKSPSAGGRSTRSSKNELQDTTGETKDTIAVSPERTRRGRGRPKVTESDTPVEEQLPTSTRSSRAKARSEQLASSPAKSTSRKRALVEEVQVDSTESASPRKGRKDTKRTSPEKKKTKKEVTPDAPAATESPVKGRRTGKTSSKSEVDTTGKEAASAAAKPGTSSPRGKGAGPGGRAGRKRKLPDIEDKVGEPEVKVLKKDEKMADVQSAEAVEGGNDAEVQAEDLGYIVIDIKDIPAANSDEVKSSVPKEPAVKSDEAALKPVVAPVDETDIGDTTKKPSPASKDSVTVQSSACVANNEAVTKQPPVDTEEREESGTVNGFSDKPDPLVNRRVIVNPDLKSVGTENAFSVVSYNILAECHRKRGDYRYTAEEFLTMDYRHGRIMKELVYLDGDVVCLQEVDPEYYADILSPEMNKLGYESSYIKRADEYHHEGEATFYKIDRFTCLETKKVILKESAEKDIAQSSLTDADKAAIRQYLNHPTVVLINKLRCKKTDQSITIGNIHVVFGHFKLPDVQCIQIANAFREVISVAGGTENPHIVCGDFNSTPTTPGYQLARDGYLSDEMLNKLQATVQVDLANGEKASLVNLMWKGFQHTSSNIKSAYYVCKGCEPVSTSRNHLVNETVDYVWYSMSTLAAQSVHETLELTTKTPTKILPSDHVSLQSSFKFIC